MEIYQVTIRLEAIGIVNNTKTCILNNTSNYGEAIKTK